jgi:hypothetical protein
MHTPHTNERFNLNFKQTTGTWLLTQKHTSTHNFSLFVIITYIPRQGANTEIFLGSTTLNHTHYVLVSCGPSR